MNYSIATKYSRVEYEAICLTAKAWIKLGRSSGQYSQAQQQICSRMEEKEKNQGVAVAQYKFKAQPDWNVLMGP